MKVAGWRGVCGGRRFNLLRLADPLGLGTAILLAAVVFGAAACPYHFVTRPSLPDGILWVEVEMFQNQSAEPELGALLATAFEAELGAQDRLRRGGGGDPKQGAYLRGRVRADHTAPVAFPPALLGAGLYTEGVSVELRLQSSTGQELARTSLAEEASFEAGAGPERTEANRRRALSRIAGRLAQRGWETLLQQVSAKQAAAPPAAPLSEGN